MDGAVVLRFALAYGFRNIQTILMKMKVCGIFLPESWFLVMDVQLADSPALVFIAQRGKCPYDFVEIMACPR